MTLAKIHYEFGFISYDEYNERVDVALWLSDETNSNDPRLDDSGDSNQEKGHHNELENQRAVSRLQRGDSASADHHEDMVEFICLGTWIFTKADRDSYPSVPHGHYQNQNRPWPKLNPYTGRVFVSKHQENIAQRLSKNEMTDIWQDESFKSFCREMIVWYQEQFPYYEFPTRRPLRMPRW